jgi:hypothetical protein
LSNTNPIRKKRGYDSEELTVPVPLLTSVVLLNSFLHCKYRALYCYVRQNILTCTNYKPYSPDSKTKWPRLSTEGYPPLFAESNSCARRNRYPSTWPKRVENKAHRSKPIPLPTSYRIYCFWARFRYEYNAARIDTNFSSFFFAEPWK